MSLWRDEYMVAGSFISGASDLLIELFRPCDNRQSFRSRPTSEINGFIFPLGCRILFWRRKQQHTKPSCSIKPTAQVANIGGCRPAGVLAPSSWSTYNNSTHGFIHPCYMAPTQWVAQPTAVLGRGGRRKNTTHPPYQKVLHVSCT